MLQNSISISIDNSTIEEKFDVDSYVANDVAQLVKKYKLKIDIQQPLSIVTMVGRITDKDSLNTFNKFCDEIKFHVNNTRDNSQAV